MRNILFSILGFVVVAIAVAVVGAGAWLMIEVSRFKDIPKEKWVCVDAFGYGHDVRWDSKHPGTNVFVESPERVELFALSCLANSKGNCFENDGWFGATIRVTGPGEPVMFSFERESPNVDDSMRHHATLYWELARNIIAAFRAGTEAEIVTLGKQNEVLKTTNVRLEGFGAAMDECIAIWAQEAKKKS